MYSTDHLKINIQGEIMEYDSKDEECKLTPAPTPVFIGLPSVKTIKKVQEVKITDTLCKHCKKELLDSNEEICTVTIFSNLATLCRKCYDAHAPMLKMIGKEFDI